MDEIRNWIISEGSGHYFFIAFPICLVVLFVLLKGRRVKFVVPSLLMVLVIVNPWFYSVWDRIGLYAYWRVLWVLPVISVVAAVVPGITEKLGRRLLLKGVVVAVAVALAAVGGTFLYRAPGGAFVRATNGAKEPDEIVRIVDWLLECDARPRVVFQRNMGVYARQYAGEIAQLYGRDIYGYIQYASDEAKTIYGALNDPDGDLKEVATLMANDAYDYLVFDGAGQEKALAEAGFELKGVVADHGIYQAHGTPSVINERNEQGLVVASTLVDEDGNPVNGEAGYAKISWKYDRNGLAIREFRTDVDGVGVADANGSAGYERAYDSLGHVLVERFIDPEGNAVVNGSGYSEKRCLYEGSDLILESYYDTKGWPVNRVDTGYAALGMTYDGWHNMTSVHYYNAAGAAVNNIDGYAVIERQYDRQGNMILQRFKDVDGRLVVTGSGYAEVHRTYNGGHLIREEYFGADGMPYLQPGGYYGIGQEWTGDVLASRTYLGSDGQPIGRTDGYSRAVWESGESCTDLRFYDLDGEAVDIMGLNLARDVRGNKDGWSDWITPVYNTVNSCQNIGVVNAGPKADGDVCTSSIEIEFKNVTATEGHAFRFLTQGAQDGRWFTGNVWNWNLINLDSAPENGMYTYTATVVVTGDMVDVAQFTIGFRCDYWASGGYRVRNVKIERGDRSTVWSPGV